MFSGCQTVTAHWPNKKTKVFFNFHQNYLIHPMLVYTTEPELELCWIFHVRSEFGDTTQELNYCFSVFLFVDSPRTLTRQQEV